MTLGDPVAEGDGVHFERNAPRHPDACFGCFRQGSQMNVPGIHFRPAVDDSDERLVEILICETKGAQQSAVRSSRVTPNEQVTSLFHP
jgi:hypothetical protein